MHTQAGNHLPLPIGNSNTDHNSAPTPTTHSLFMLKLPDDGKDQPIHTSYFIAPHDTPKSEFFEYISNNTVVANVLSSRPGDAESFITAAIREINNSADIKDCELIVGFVETNKVYDLRIYYALAAKYAVAKEYDKVVNVFDRAIQNSLELDDNSKAVRAVAKLNIYNRANPSATDSMLYRKSTELIGGEHGCSDTVMVALQDACRQIRERL